MEKQKERKLLIVDGHNLLFQMFYGMPSRIINKDGIAIQGVLGFVGALNKIINMTKPSHIVALFDSEQHNERKNVVEEYKANRIDYAEVSVEKNPFSQLPYVYKALDFMKIKYTEVRGYETDDVIASYAIKYGDEIQCVIASWDSDYFQLINKQVSVLRYRGKLTTLCDSEFIRNKFGIEPEVYADFKSLTGDQSDNIKGAYKVGVKTAAKLLNQFENLENILVNTEQIDKLSVRQSIIESRETLRKNYQVIKLTDRAEIPFTLIELKYSGEMVKTNDVLVGIGLK